MKVSELLRTIGKPIAYYPELSKPLGGVTASILFGQLFYWHDKTDNPLGVYKTQEELRDETGLSRTELETARKKLKAIGILIETEKRLEHRIYFKLDLAAFDALLLGIRETANPAPPSAETVPPPVQESCIRETANPATVIDQENTNTRLQHNILVSPKTATPTKPQKFSDDDLKTAHWIFDLILKINPNNKTPNFERWANEIRLLRERDWRTHREICELFQFANADNFWCANIRSPAKLREHWDRLMIEKNKPTRKPTFSELNAAEWNTPEAWSETF